MKLSERIRKWARGLPKGHTFADEVAQLEDENEALRRYAHHTPSCSPKPVCNCGFDTFLASIQESE